MDPITRGSHLPSGCLSTSVYRPSWAKSTSRIVRVPGEQPDAADAPVHGLALVEEVIDVHSLVGTVETAHADVDYPGPYGAAVIEGELGLGAQRTHACWRLARSSRRLLCGAERPQKLSIDTRGGGHERRPRPSCPAELVRPSSSGPAPILRAGPAGPKSSTRSTWAATRTTAPDSRAMRAPAATSMGLARPRTAADARPAPTLARHSADEPRMRVAHPCRPRRSTSPVMPSQGTVPASSVSTTPPARLVSRRQRTGPSPGTGPWPSPPVRAAAPPGRGRR